jgi:HECT-domain (ubiquitin-transferase)
MCYYLVSYHIESCYVMLCYVIPCQLISRLVCLSACLPACLPICLPACLSLLSLHLLSSHPLLSPLTSSSHLTPSYSLSSQNLVWVEENADSHHLSLFFTAAAEYLQESHCTYEGIFPDRKGVLQSIELKPGGSDVLVTDLNKKEFVALMVMHCTEGRFGVQASAVREGILDILPESCLEMFNDRYSHPSLLHPIMYYSALSYPILLYFILIYPS